MPASSNNAIRPVDVYLPCRSKAGANQMSLLQSERSSREMLKKPSSPASGPFEVDYRETICAAAGNEFGPHNKRWSRPRRAFSVRSGFGAGRDVLATAARLLNIIVRRL